MFRSFFHVPIRFRVVLACAIVIVSSASYLCFRDASLPVSSVGGTAQYIFVIDAGHGGEDGGASTAEGVAESGINLSVSRKLDDLMHLLGRKTVMVRREDTAVYSPGCKTFSEKKVSDLHNRVNLVNETTGAFLVSIHQNQFPESKYSGAQVFYNSVAPAEDTAKALQSKLDASLDPGNNRKAKNRTIQTSCKRYYYQATITILNKSA